MITNGYGAMYSYADRVPPADRWAIAAYIRALQRTKPPINTEPGFQGPTPMIRGRALLVGVLGLVGCAIGLVLVPREALVAWLVCWLGWGSIPIGALALLMLVALIPGTLATPLCAGRWCSARR